MRVLLILAPALAAAIAPALWHDVFRSYVRSPDPDIIFAYQPLSLNDGVNNINAEHTGYVYFVLFAWLLRLLRIASMISADRVSAMTGLGAEAFDAAFAQVVFAGRFLSMAEALIFVVLVFCGVRVTTRSLAAAGMAALLTGGSLGIAIQAMLLRTELLSALFVHACLFCLIVAARSTERRNTMLLGCAGLFAALAMATKVQAIIPLLLILPLALLLGTTPPPDDSRGESSERRLLTALFVLVTGVFSLPAGIMLVAGIAERKSSGHYQAAILVCIIAAMVAYGVIYRVPRQRFLRGATAIAFGFSAGILFHLVYRNPPATDAIAAFIEHMKTYSHIDLAQADGVPPVGRMMEILAGTLERTLQRHLAPLAYPTMLAECAIVAGSLLLFTNGQWRTAISALALLTAAIGAEVAFGLRGQPNEYFVYVDPWRALAFGVVLAALVERNAQTARWALIVCVAVVLIVVAMNFRTAMDPRFLLTQPSDAACGQAKGYLPRLAHQFAKFCG